METGSGTGPDVGKTEEELICKKEGGRRERPMEEGLS